MLGATKVCHLIMILEEGDKCACRDAQRTCTARTVLPVVILPLVKVSVLGCGDKLLGLSQMVAKITFSAAGECDDCTVMEIIIPHRIQTEAIFFDRANQARVLRLVFGHHNCFAMARCFSDGL